MIPWDDRGGVRADDGNIDYRRITIVLSRFSHNPFNVNQRKDKAFTCVNSNHYLY